MVFRFEIKDFFWKHVGMPTEIARKVRWAIRVFGRHNYVVPRVMRRGTEELDRFAIGIAQYEGRPCVWVALQGVVVIFDVDDVSNYARRLLRRRPYTMRR